MRSLFTSRTEMSWGPVARKLRLEGFSGKSPPLSPAGLYGPPVGTRYEGATRIPWRWLLAI